MALSFLWMVPMLQRAFSKLLPSTTFRAASTTAPDWFHFELKDEDDYREDLLKSRGQITSESNAETSQAMPESLESVWNAAQEKYKSVQRCLGRELDPESASLVEWFHLEGIPGENLLRCLDRFPELLHISPSSLKQKIGHFRGMGMRKSAVYEMFLSYPEIMGLDFTQDITPVVDYFEHSLGKRASVMDLISKAPVVLTYSLEKEIEPKVDFLKSLHLGRCEIASVIENHPSFLTLSLDHSIRPKIDYLKNRLRNLHIPKSIVTFPPFLSMSLEADIKDKVDFYLDTLEVHPMKLSEYLPYFPQILSYDIELEIKPMIEFVSRRMHVVVGRRKRMRIMKPESLGFVACPSIMGFTIPQFNERLERIREMSFRNDDMVDHVLERCPLVFGCTVKSEDIERIGLMLLENLDGNRSFLFRILTQHPEILCRDPNDIEALLESMVELPLKNRAVLLTKKGRVSKGLETIKRVERL